MILGIDPAQRHTGMCLLKTDSTYLFHEIKTTEDVLSSTRQIKKEMVEWTRDNCSSPESLTYSLERQLSVGGYTSALQYHFQVTVLEGIAYLSGNYARLVFPLPIQLKSYIKKLGGDIKSPSTIVRSFKKLTGYKGRISQHCVDGYYLARLAEDVILGKFQYKLPSKDYKIVPWEIMHGSEGSD